MMPGIILLISMSALMCVGSVANAANCGNCDAFLSEFREVVQDVEEDLASVRSGQRNAARWPLTDLEQRLRECFECVDQVCGTSEKKEILDYWQKFVLIQKSGELPSPPRRIMVDPYPRR
jgi:hypothetical protein